MQENPTASYADDATLLDSFLDERLAAIRRQEDAGDLTALEDANMRIEVLSHHLATLRNLRREHFGEDV